MRVNIYPQECQKVVSGEGRRSAKRKCRVETRKIARHTRSQTLWVITSRIPLALRRNSFFPSFFSKNKNKTTRHLFFVLLQLSSPERRVFVDASKQNEQDKPARNRKKKKGQKILPIVPAITVYRRRRCRGQLAARFLMIQPNKENEWVLYGMAWHSQALLSNRLLFFSLTPIFFLFLLLISPLFLLSLCYSFSSFVFHRRFEAIRIERYKWPGIYIL